MKHANKHTNRQHKKRTGKWSLLKWGSYPPIICLKLGILTYINSLLTKKESIKFQYYFLRNFEKALTGVKKPGAQSCVAWLLQNIAWIIGHWIFITFYYKKIAFDQEANHEFQSWFQKTSKRRWPTGLFCYSNGSTRWISASSTR